MSAENDKATDAGIVAGLDYAVGFLLGGATAFGDVGRHGSLGHAFKSAATELGRVTPEMVRADWP